MKKLLGPALTLLLAIGAIYGCSKEATPEQKIAAGNLTPDPLSEAELRRFASSVRKVDGDAEAHYQLALHFQENHRHKLAIDELRKVLQRNPSHVKAYNAVGVSYDNLGDHDAAIESYRIALKIDSKLDYVYNNLGYSYLLNGQTADAVSAFRQSIEISPKEKRYRNNLGLAYIKQDQYDLALEQFRFLDTSAGAERTFAKVMKDLGKGGKTEQALAEARTIPVLAAKAEGSSAAMPDLSKDATAKPARDPITRFQAMTESPGPVHKTETQAAVPESAEEKAPVSVFAVRKTESASTSVIQVPAPPATGESLYELKISAAVSPPAHVNLAVREPIYFPIASVALARSSTESAQLQPGTTGVAMDHRQREAAASQDRVESREIQEERLLIAASATRAVGWQNAPEPRTTAGNGLIQVEVANGNGVKGSAGKVAVHLRRNGFEVIRVVDAQSHDHFSTKVFYYGNIAEARRVLAAIPEVAGDAEMYEMESMGNHIRVLVGRDLIGRNGSLTWSSNRKGSP